MHRVAMIRMSLLKYGSLPWAWSRLSARVRLEEGSISTPTLAAARMRGSNMRGVGVGWRRSMAQLAKCATILPATVQLARSIISSTIWLASRTWYMPTSMGSCVSVSSSKRTSGEASVSAPASPRRLRRIFAMRFISRRDFVIGSLTLGSSIRVCASRYDMAALLLMMLLLYLTPTTSASGVISQRTENASRSTSARREQISSVSGLGSMSMRRWTRYTDVPRREASRSMGAPLCTKLVTSAMWTPTSKLPLGSSRTCSASSMSRQPGGSTEQMLYSRRSIRLGSARSSSPTLQGSAGTHWCTATVNGEVLTSCSITSTSVSVSLSPMVPRVRT
mmetsp:Transcript_62634/g.198322  ORF Transcript_62634/g.198322 Transcript_62634/m.198322 type:complete len:334 (-) Transcript_62634:323-1324(-)